MTESKRRHRFVRMDERLENLQAELQLHGKTNAAAEALSFQEELALQAELTMIESFQVLYRKLQPLVTTTPQLLHHVKKVARLLQQELRQAPSADVQRERVSPVLKLLTALARELRKEFYPYFAGILPDVIAIIDTKDPELSTQVFKTITMLFNHLRVQILKDMEAVHKCYFPLLGHPKPFVRDFAAQTLSVLLRRVDSSKDLKKYLSTYFRALARGSGKDDEVLMDGSAKLLVALMRNVNHGFHSRMGEIFLFLLGAFRPKDDATQADAAAQRAVVYDIVRITSELLTKHTDAENAGEMLECFTLALAKLAATTDTDSDAECLYLSRILHLFSFFVRYRGGRLVTHAKHVKAVQRVATQLLARAGILSTCSEPLREELVPFFEGVWRLFPDSASAVAAQVKAVFHAADASASESVKTYWRARLLQLAEYIFAHTSVAPAFVKTHVFPNVLHLAFETLLGVDVAAFAALVTATGNYLAAHDEVADENSYVVFANGHRFVTYAPVQQQAQTDASLLSIATRLTRDSVDATTEADAKSALAVAWKFCKALALLRVDDDKLLAFATPALSQVEMAVAKHPTVAAEFGALRAELWRLVQIAEHQKSHRTQKLSADVVVAALSGKQRSFATLSAFFEFVQMKTEAQQHALLSKDGLEAVADLLKDNLRAQSHELRLVTLEILARTERREFLEAGDATLLGKCDLPDVCLSLERLCSGVSVDTEREVIRLIGRVKILCRSPQTPLVYKVLAVNHLFGLYHVKFATIWPHIADAVDVAARAHFPEVWGITAPELLAASVRQDAKSSSDAKAAATSGGNNNEDVAMSAADATSTSARQIEREFAGVCALESGRIDPASVTDLSTHHALLWKGLEKFSELVEAKTKFVVPLFLVFLRDQYAAIYTDELSPSILEGVESSLAKLDGAGTLEVAAWRSKRVFAELTTKHVRAKFLDQLKLFATFKNMKGAFANGLLHELFFDLLMKSDEVVSKLALRCLFCFGKKHLTPYKEQLNRIADAATFREELTTFDISEDAGMVLKEHRPQLLPVLLRLLYSKCVSKKGRNTGDTVAARRAAILAYLAALEEAELASFVELVVRAFDVTLAPSAARAHVTEVALEGVQPSRVLGFLNLLEDLVGQLGTKLAAYVPTIADLLVSILKFNADAAAPMDVDEDEPAAANDEDGEPQHKPEFSASMRKQIRMLVYRRLAEIVDTFDHVVVLRPWVEAVFVQSSDAIAHLPNAVVGASKASALLDFLVSVARGLTSRSHLTPTLVKSVVSCLSAGLETANSDAAPARGLSPEILDSVLQFMASLLDGDEASLVECEESKTAPLLIPEIPFVLDQFVARFHSKTARYAAERYAGSSKKELVFLCRLSVHIDASAALSATPARDLFQLLLPFLLRNHHPSQADTENILAVLAQLVPQLAEPKKHVLSLSKLLAPGPNCITERSAREKLIGVFQALGRHPTLAALAPVAELLEALNAYDAKKIEEIDFERRVDALSAVNAAAFAGFVDDSHLLAPVISQYLHSMHDGEFSIRSGALAGLTTFVQLVATAVAADAEAADKSVILNALESLVMPCVRVSLKSPVEDTRRGFVMLLGSLADHHAALRRFAFVHADLALLRNKEDPEADFFFNITHIQAHRKRRALQRVAQLMDEMAAKMTAAAAGPSADAMEVDDGAAPEWFTNSTVNNVLLPLVMHFIYEAQTKSQESIRAEAAACVGSAAGLLGWSHYLALLRRLLKSIDGHGELESTIIQAICAVIDHFHYPAPGAIVEWDSTLAPSRRARAVAAAGGGAATPLAPVDESGGSKIQDSLEAQVLPMLKKYLFKGVTRKGKEKAAGASFDASAVASQDVAVRVPLALAIVKVLRRLRAGAFYLEFPKLLLSITRLLKSKDEAVRSSARLTLVRITMELGASYLLPVVEELKATLRDGYMVHVLSYTLHAILEKVATLVSPAKPRSLADTAADAPEVQERDFASPLDACVPSMMDILLDDLFRGVVENQDGSEQRKSKMKEAKGSRSLDALELLARTMAFLPNPSVHGVVAALVRRFREAENAKSALVLHEALKRVALGLVKNPSVDTSYVYLYVFNLMHACLESLRPLTELEKAKYKAAAATVKNAGGAVVSSWLVNEKSARATAALAQRAPRIEGAKVALQGRMTGFDRHALQDAKDSVTHLEELLNFAVFLVFAFLRAGEITPALVDPLVPHLMRCAAEVKSNKAVVNALKALAVLLHHHDIPAMDVALAPLVDRLFKIIHKAGAATRNEMVQTCYRTLTGILKHRGDAYRLTEPQLRVLLSFVRADLEERDHQNATYALLKSIVASRLVIPEVYDVMLRVGELLVQSDAQSARGNCAAIYLSFLLEYPLGPKRLAHHLTFLLNNLSYAYESGRRAVLEALAALLKKLPLELLNERAQFFLLPLVLRLANDEAAACRELAADVIRTLLRRMGNRQLNESVLLLGQWWQQSADAKLLGTAAQVTALVLETRPEFLDKSHMALFADAERALLARLAVMDALDDSRELEWQVVVHVLASLAKFGEHLGGRFESWLSTTGLSLLDAVVLPLLEYPHALVRTAALRFLTAYLRRRDPETLRLAQPLKKLSSDVTGDEFLRQPGKLFALASGVAKLFDKPEFGADVAAEATFALSFLVGALESFAAIPQFVSTPAVPAANVDEDDADAKDEEGDEEEENNDEGAKSGSDDDSEDAQAATTTITAAQEQQDTQAKANTPVGWLLTRLSFLSRAVQCREGVRVAVFQLFAALVSQRSAAFAERYLLQLLNPLFRAASARSERPGGSPESALLAQEVLELLEAKIGAARFMDAYTFVQKKLAVFRATRREQRKRDFVSDPQLAARRKLQKNETKRRAKQLKKRKYTVMKGTASAATRPRKALRPGAE